MLTVEAHHQWEQRYYEYDQLKQLIVDTQTQLAKCPNNGCLAPSLATDMSSDTAVPCALAASKPTLAQPRAVRALPVAAQC
jgi:hypothetical protein